MKPLDVRRAVEEDLEALSRLMGAHAAFERAGPPTATREALRRAMFDDPPMLLAWVARVKGVAAGYLTATRDFSTWRCAPFLHMDCLYVDVEHRGSGVGAALFDALTRFADAHGIDEIQWQTPEWNERAANFYRRLGAMESNKRRFALARPTAVSAL
jgi:ribosomal protein S18 acetylase RimI-like enzyme